MPRAKLYQSAAEKQKAYRARKKESVHFRSRTDMWATPQALFDELNAEFGFTLDVCAEPFNAKCPRYFTPRQDGLKQRWEGVCWMNPPYGRGVGDWIEKAKVSAQENGATVVCLMPARTDTSWWHEHILGSNAEVRFLPGRLKFGNQENSAPFPSVIVIFRGLATMTQALVPAQQRTAAKARPADFVPTIVRARGEECCRRFLEYFTLRLKAPSTRRAYWRACTEFLEYAHTAGVATLAQIEPKRIAMYLEKRVVEGGTKSATPRQVLAALRGLLDYFVEAGDLPYNPAMLVKPPPREVRRPKVRSLQAAEILQILEAIPTAWIIEENGVTVEVPDLRGLRDRALLSLVVACGIREGEVPKLQVGDYLTRGKRRWIRITTHSGKTEERLVPQDTQEALELYLTASGIGTKKKSPLFRSSPRRQYELSERAMTPEAILEMVKRRSSAAGIRVPIRMQMLAGVRVDVTGGE